MQTADAKPMTSNVELLPLPGLPVAVERFILSSLGPRRSGVGLNELLCRNHSGARNELRH
jgi:hypothetical protein